MHTSAILRVLCTYRCSRPTHAGPHRAAVLLQPRALPGCKRRCWHGVDAQRRIFGPVLAAVPRPQWVHCVGEAPGAASPRACVRFPLCSGVSRQTRTLRAAQRRDCVWLLRPCCGGVPHHAWNRTMHPNPINSSCSDHIVSHTHPYRSLTGISCGD
eukprot:gene11103-biopygen15386